MSKHTPGPWELRYDDIITANKIDPIEICALNHDPAGDPPVDAEANARLIADAPTMKDYIEYVEAKIDIDEMPFSYDQWIQMEKDLQNL